MIGKTLSHYTILEEITRGELQTVYRAHDESSTARSRSKSYRRNW